MEENIDGRHYYSGALIIIKQNWNYVLESFLSFILPKAGHCLNVLSEYFSALAHDSMFLMNDLIKGQGEQVYSGEYGKGVENSPGIIPPL